MNSAKTLFTAAAVVAAGTVIDAKPTEAATLNPFYTTQVRIDDGSTIQANLTFTLDHNIEPTVTQNSFGLNEYSYSSGVLGIIGENLNYSQAVNASAFPAFQQFTFSGDGINTDFFGDFPISFETEPTATNFLDVISNNFINFGFSVENGGERMFVFPGTTGEPELSPVPLPAGGLLYGGLIAAAAVGTTAIRRRRQPA